VGGTSEPLPRRSRPPVASHRTVKLTEGRDVGRSAELEAIC
jgi:hypothetical protein